MSKLPEDWCSRVIRAGLPTDPPPADVLVRRREAALVWHHLVQSGGASACPPPMVTALHQSNAARALEAELLNRELRRVLAAAQDAGVSLVTIKGAAIAHTHYPQPHLRPRGDSDLVILPHHRDAMFRVLRTCGYSPSGAVDGDLVTRQGQWQLPLGRGLIHTLDVHWEIFNPHTFAGVLSVAEVLAGSVPVPALGSSARAPHPVHALLLACAHRVAHHAGDEDILWLYDIRLLAESLSEHQAEEFITLAASRRVSTVCADGLNAARRVVGGQHPVTLQSWIQSGTWRDATEPTAAFLHQHRQVDHLLFDLRALPNLASRVMLLWQHLFPRPGYMLTRYRAGSRLMLPYLYLRRIIIGTPRWFTRGNLNSNSDSDSD